MNVRQAAISPHFQAPFVDTRLLRVVGIVHSFTQSLFDELICNDPGFAGTLILQASIKQPTQIQDCSIPQFVLLSWKTARHSLVS